MYTTYWHSDFLFWLKCFVNCCQSACADSSQTLKTAATPWCHPWRRNGTFLNWLPAQWGKAWTHTAPVFGGPRLERVPNQVIQFYLCAVFPVYQSCSQTQKQILHKIFQKLKCHDDEVHYVNTAVTCPTGLTEAGTGSTLKSSLCSLSDFSDSDDEQ